MSEPICIRPLPQETQKACLTIALPWPYSSLSPNDHSGWRAKNANRKEAVGVGKYCTVEALYGRRLELRGELEIELVFFPPDHRWYDLDNLITRMKHYQDGVCLALDIDDHRITKRIESFGPVDPYKKGTVMAFLRERG